MLSNNCASCKLNPICPQSAANLSLPMNYTNWAKYEPNNAGCYEKCVFANYDTTWNDYACNFIPIWDNCSDIIYTICHNSSNKGKDRVSGELI